MFLVGLIIRFIPQFGDAFSRPPRSNSSSSSSINSLSLCGIDTSSCVLWLTLCLSMRRCLRWGSKRSWVGSMLIGDCRRPLLHRFHSGLTRPQKSGPVHYQPNSPYHHRLLLSMVAFISPVMNDREPNCNHHGNDHPNHQSEMTIINKITIGYYHNYQQNYQLDQRLIASHIETMRQRIHQLYAH